MDDQNSLLDKTLKKLFEVAFDDKVVTDEEFELIHEVEFQVSRFENALSKALEDGIITDEERNQLNDLKTEILGQTESYANFDGTISDEEKALIKSLATLIDQYFKY